MAILSDAIQKSLSKIGTDEDDEDLSTGDLSNLVEFYDRLLRKIEENAKRIQDYYSPNRDIKTDFDISNLFQMIGN